jgi:hypothetical protein
MVVVSSRSLDGYLKMVHRNSEIFLVVLIFVLLLLFTLLLPIFISATLNILVPWNREHILV